jgi:hypothetical protein
MSRSVKPAVADNQVVARRGPRRRAPPVFVRREHLGNGHGTVRAERPPRMRTRMSLHRSRLLSRLCLLGLAGGALVACGALVDASSEAPTKPSANAPLGEVGAACAFDEDCKSGLCSAGESTGTCGQCLDVHGLGESCDDVRTGCRRSASCRNGTCVSNKKTLGEGCPLGPLHEDIEACDDELYCMAPLGGDSGECAKRIAPGGGCAGHDPPCVLGFVCFNGACVDQRTLAGEGESCLSLRCAAGLGCSSPTAGYKCRVSTLPLGAPCGLVDGDFVDGECATGSACGRLESPDGGGTRGTVSTCLPLPRAGERCVDHACVEGLYCDETEDRCAPLRREGEACVRAGYGRIDCAAGLECRKGRCEQPCR